MAAFVESTFNQLASAWHALEYRLIGDHWTPAHIPSLIGKVALVSGANSGIGFETTRKLVENGCKVYMVSRDLQNGQEAASRIRAQVGKGAQVEVLQCDMLHMRNVVRLAEEFRSQGEGLDILINNAGVFFPGPYMMTPEGLEQSLAVNYYAHALLTLMLLDKIKPGGRIVMMSSEGEGPLSKFDATLSNIRGDKYKDSGLQPYGDAKLYCIMFAHELAGRLKGAGRDIDVFAVQPGLVNTPGHNKMDRKHYLSAWQISGMGKLFGQTAYNGAWSTIYAATEPSLKGKGHAYYGPTMFGLFHTREVEPGNKAGRNPISCYQLFAKSMDVLKDIVGQDKLAQVPPNPDEFDPNAHLVSPHKVAKAA